MAAQDDLGESEETESRPCPMCGEPVALDSRACPFCGEILDAGDRVSAGINPELVRRFRKEVHGLGAFWILMGLLIAVVFQFLIPEGGRILNPQFHKLFKIFSLVFAGLYLVVGLFTCTKRLWAIYVGTALTYLAIISYLTSIIRNFHCAILFWLVVSLIVVAQAHRVIRMAGRIRDEGLPLSIGADELLEIR